MSEAYAIEPEEPMDAEPEAATDILSFIGQTNIAGDIPDDVLTKMGSKVCEEFKVDEESRATGEWDKRQLEALKLAMQVKEAKNTPWPNASNVKYPLVTVAAIQFAARAYPAIVDGMNVAKGKILGKPDDDKRARAERIGRHMSYQLLEEMDEWEEETDQLLHILPCTGTVHRKTYFDPMKGRNCSEIVTSDKCVVNYWAKADPLRVTQVCEFYPHEILSKVRSKLWLDVDLGQAENAANDDDAPHTFLEQHRLWDLDGDGFPEPYVVMVHKETMKVVRVVARFEERGIKRNDEQKIYAIEPVRYFTRYRFMPSLDGSYYGMGFGTLLGALNEVINSTLNQLMDAGHLANTQGGFLGAGVTLKSGSQTFKPGEWKRVESPGPSLKDNIVPLPIGEPSAVLFNLLGMLIEAAKDVTATKDILTGETGSANQPVGTTLAQIEQGLKTYSAIIKRIHRGLKRELGALYTLNAIYLDPQVYYTFQDEQGEAAQDDYAQGDMDVVPYSDPSMATDMQKMGRAQFLMQFRADPLMDGKEINKRVLEAASMGDVEDLFAKEPPHNPEAAVEAAKLEMQSRTADQKDRELDIKEREVDAGNAQKMAAAQKTAIEAIMLAPEFQAAVAQFIDARVAELTGSASGQIQQPDLSGMAPAPTDEAVPAVPEGPPVEAGEPMGEGQLDEPGDAEPGFDAGEPVGPGL